VEIRWLPSCQGWLGLNTDGAASTGYRGLSRDANGVWITVFAETLGRIHPTLLRVFE